jgi:hypothetical protein
MSIARRASPLQESNFSWYLGVAVSCLVLGVALGSAPVIAWGLIGAFIGLLLFQASAYIWVSAAILTVTLSRFFVATGWVPGVVNFFHFPLALSAAFVAAMTGPPQRPIAQTIGVGCILLLFLSFASWMFTSGELLRPLLTWLVFTEPFLVLYAVVHVPLSGRQEQFLWKLALAISFIQLPLALWQTLTLGLSDPDRIQGSFVGMGAGHHIAGGIALMGGSICVAKGILARSSRKRVMWLLSGLALFLIPILSDAKQNIMAFLPALGYLVMALRGGQGKLSRRQWTGLAVILPILALAIYAAFIFYPPLQVALDWEQVSHGLQGKTGALLIIAEKLSHRPSGWFFGLGPGNSVSRVALMGMEGYIKADSPVTLLGLTTARTTEEIWDLTFHSDWLFSRSSVWSGISSWFGLFGDIGLLGLGVYLWMCWRVWRSLGKTYLWQVSVARSALIMIGILGAIYSWLEEPGFTFPIALVVGLGLLANDRMTASVPRAQQPPQWHGC